MRQTHDEHDESILSFPRSAVLSLSLNEQGHHQNLLGTKYLWIQRSDGQM